MLTFPTRWPQRRSSTGICTTLISHPRNPDVFGKALPEALAFYCKSSGLQNVVVATLYKSASVCSCGACKRSSAGRCVNNTSSGENNSQKSKGSADSQCCACSWRACQGFPPCWPGRQNWLTSLRCKLRPKATSRFWIPKGNEVYFAANSDIESKVWMDKWSWFPLS